MSQVFLWKGMINVNLSSSSKKIYAVNRTEWEKLSVKSYFSNRELNVIELENGIVLPPRYGTKNGEYIGGVCDENFQFIAGLNRQSPSQPGGWFSICSAYKTQQESIIQSDDSVIFGGVIIDHFGHFILECFGRLWYALIKPEMNVKIVIILIGREQEYFYDFWKLLDIPRERVMIIRQATKFSKIIIPEESVHSWYNYTIEHLLPYRYMTKKVNASGPRKIYLTRSKLRDGVICLNEEYFENFYSGKGFTVIAPEQLTITEQVALMSGADEVVAVMGSLTHWALFCKPGTIFTMLLRTDKDTLLSQCLVNEASQVQWRIVDVSMNLLHSNRSFGVCLIGPTKNWKKYVFDYYGENVVDESWKNLYHDYLLAWYQYCDKNNLFKSEYFDFKKAFLYLFQRVMSNESLTRDFAKNKQEIEKILGRPFLYCQVKLSGLGWQAPVSEAYTCGNPNQHYAVNGIKMYFSSVGMDIYYSVCTEKMGWFEEVATNKIIDFEKKGEMVGNIIGIRMKLDESTVKEYDILYRIHGCGKEWTAWVKNNYELYSIESTPINAIEIKLERNA